MIYLIGQMLIWLLLTAAFAALAGWAFAAERSAPREAALQRERKNLLRDLTRHVGHGSALGSDPGEEREADALRRTVELRDGRIRELEAALESARGRIDEAAGEIAELQRRDAGLNEDDALELSKLRALAEERANVVDVEVSSSTPEPDEDASLQMWRLRYFEQRVRYLESNASPNMPEEAAPEEGPPSQPPILEWRARDAEARAEYLEQELRAVSEGPSAMAEIDEPAEAEATAFAANAEVDALLRWRLLYLERRVAHLQAASSEPQLADIQSADIQPIVVAGADTDQWKWRARYLEARVRHLEEQPRQVRDTPSAPAESAVDTRSEKPPAPKRRGTKPPVLPAARHGAPDDLTLIEGVSLQQQSTFYSLGVFHFDQIASWTPEHVAWVDNYLRLRGRIEEEEWVEQANELAREGPSAARRELADEEA